MSWLLPGIIRPRRSGLTQLAPVPVLLAAETCRLTASSDSVSRTAAGVAGEDAYGLPDGLPCAREASGEVLAHSQTITFPGYSREIVFLSPNQPSQYEAISPPGS